MTLFWMLFVSNNFIIIHKTDKWSDKIQKLIWQSEKILISYRNSHLILFLGGSETGDHHIPWFWHIARTSSTYESLYIYIYIICKEVLSNFVYEILYAVQGSKLNAIQGLLRKTDVRVLGSTKNYRNVLYINMYCSCDGCCLQHQSILLTFRYFN